MKTDLEIMPHELRPPAARQLGEFEAILRELQRISSGVNAMIPRVQAAIGHYVDGAASVKMRDIIALTSAYYGVSEVDILSSRRQFRIALVRQVAMFLCQRLTPRSYSEIGLFFCGRDHTTIMHAVRTIEELRTKDADIATAIDSISQQIKDKCNV